MAYGNLSIWSLYISVLLLIPLVCAVASNNREELQVSEVLNNLAYDNITKSIFIGGVNVLLKASASLVEIKRYKTGPNLDYIDCYQDKGQICPGKTTNNTNKVLLVDNTKRRLVTCGSYKHGVCQIRSLDTLAVQTDGTVYVVSNAPLPAMALITPWGKTPGKRAIYVATTWDRKYIEDPNLSLIKRSVVSTRIIDDLNRIFEPARDDFSYSYLQFQYDGIYQAKYIFAFSAGDFNYFVSVQETIKSFETCKQCSNDKKTFKTFIVRLCQEDEIYASYMELPLECKGSNGTTFNIAQSAYLTKAGDGLSLDASEDVLVITFFKAVRGWNGPSQNSAMCMYSVKEINAGLASNLKNCVDKDTPDEILGLPWVLNGERKCSSEVNT